MKRKFENTAGSAPVYLFVILLIMNAMNSQAQSSPAKDDINTSEGPAGITFIGHGTLMISFQGKIIHIDPYGKLADYTKLPKADLILVTHEHGDHLDSKAIDMVKKSGSLILYTGKCVTQYPGGTVLKNGDTRTFENIRIEAVPAYNIVNKRDATNVFHPKGEGNGYILTLGDKRIYIAGDTENTPEMKTLKNIDVAFLPMNLPYTMTPEMVADAAKAFKPRVLYPYHYGETDPAKVVELLKNNKEIEVRIRPMK